MWICANLYDLQTIENVLHITITITNKTTRLLFKTANKHNPLQQQKWHKCTIQSQPQLIILIIINIILLKANVNNY